MRRCHWCGCGGQETRFHDLFDTRLVVLVGPGAKGEEKGSGVLYSHVAMAVAILSICFYLKLPFGLALLGRGRWQRRAPAIARSSQLPQA